MTRPNRPPTSGHDTDDRQARERRAQTTLDDVDPATDDARGYGDVDRDRLVEPDAPTDHDLRRVRPELEDGPGTRA